jgi:hypothetical protein
MTYINGYHLVSRPRSAQMFDESAIEKLYTCSLLLCMGLAVYDRLAIESCPIIYPYEM